MNKKIIVSGMRPTGKLHLGNYWGALKNYVELQNDYECYFFIADWHALTTNEDNSKLKENSLTMVLDWLSAGLDPNKCVIFRQSDVKFHSELFLLLSMVTPLSWLLRNPTFKEQLIELYRQKYKGQENKKKAEGSLEKLANTYDFKEEENMALNSQFCNYGFLGYPVLQAADILLYGASLVPIGKDQLPHLELTREIARRFNHIYKEDIFIEPEPYLKEIQILPGLDKRKMSKSYGNTIELSDYDEKLENKIKKMFTDTNKIKIDDKGDPEGCVVFAFHKIYNKEFKKREEECKLGQIGCKDCKKHLFELMNKEMKVFVKNKEKYNNDLSLVEKILNEGAQKANLKAKELISKINKKIGII